MNTESDEQETSNSQYQEALDLAGDLLGKPLELPLAIGEPEVGNDFRRLATMHAFGIRGLEMDSIREVAHSFPFRLRRRLALLNHFVGSYELLFTSG